MSAHPHSIRTTARTRVRLLVAAGALILVVVAGVVVGLAGPASADSPAFDPQDTITPVASYSFDTAAGATVADSSGKGNNAAWKGTPSYVAGVSGTAAAVSGGANYVKLPLVAGQTDAASSFSYEFWMSEQSRTSYGPIVSNQNFVSCNNKGLTLYNQTTQGVLQACWGQTSGGTKEYVTGASSGLVNAWHYVAVVVDRVANTTTYYVDGLQTATAPAGSITASTAFNSGLAFNIGGLSGSEADTSDGYTNAAIDDFNFYNAAIPGAQVGADYAASRPNAVSYTVAFNGNGASSGTTPSQNMPSGQSVALAANGFTRTGYQFAGWATSAAGPVAYTNGQAVSNLTSTASATVTLYAVWDRYRAVGDTVAPIVSYDFDADSGSTVTDSSGNGNAGAWSGTPSYATGVGGKAAYVNSPSGSNKGVNFFSLPLISGKTDAASSFSYVFWLNETSSSTDSPIVSNQNFTHCYDQGTTLYNTDPGGVLRACFGQNGTSTGQNYLPSISPSSVIGSWHQVAVVANRSAGTMTAYLDGQQVVQSTTLTSAFTLASGFPFRVGAEGSGNDTVDGFADAYIDDFDFYAAPISAAQIQNDYAATKPSTAPTNSGSTILNGFVTDTFRMPSVRVGGAVSQPVSGLWNGGAVTHYTKVSGDSWLSVGADGTVTGTAPAAALQDPATIIVQATDGTTTSQITVEVPVIGADDSPQLATATWNLWDAGSHVSDSTSKDLAVIASNGLDVIGVQQDGGTVATALAHALGWYSVEGDGGVGIVSAYPLDVASKTTVGGGTVPAVGVTAEVPGRNLRLWSVGLDDGSYGPEAACQTGGPDAAALVTAEDATKRFSEARAVASAMSGDVAAAATTPVVLLADLESPSASDWTSATASSHCDEGAVSWPVPDQLTAAGLSDSFRVANPNPAADAGVTWSPITSKNATTGAAEPQDRIDYVDFAGTPLTVLGSNTLIAGWPSAAGIQNDAWTSNHRAVVTTFRLAPIPTPTLTVTTKTVAYRVGSAPTASELLTKVGATSHTAGAVLQIDSSSVNFAKIGTYTASVTATDPANGLHSSPVDVTVKVVPVLTISLAHASVTIALGAGQKLTAADVEAAVKPSLNVTGTISVDLSRVNDTVSGSYPVTVTGTDRYGFTASSDVIVTITVAKVSAGNSAPSQGNSAASTGEQVAPPSDAGTSSGSNTTPHDSSGVSQHGSALVETASDIWLPLGLAALVLLLVAAAVIARRVTIRRR